MLLPAALPAYLTGLRGGLGLAWMFVVAAELMGASEGLGFLLIDGQQTGRPAKIIAARPALRRASASSPTALAALGRHSSRGRTASKPPRRRSHAARSSASPSGSRAATTRSASQSRRRSRRDRRPSSAPAAAARARCCASSAGLDAATPAASRSTASRSRAPRPEVGLVFQEPRLMPWLSVRENVAFALVAPSAQASAGARGRGGARPRRPRRLCRGAAAGALRRHGAARRHCPRAGGAAAGAAARRAVQRARRLHPLRAAGSSARHSGAPTGRPCCS